MQTIKGTLRISADEQRWVDRLGVECTPPIIFIGARVRLVMDLRGDNESDEGELPVYDIGQFSDVTGWYLALDGDFNQTTSPIILRNSGIGVETANGRTVLTVTVPDTDSTAMRNALSTEREVSLTLEIGGLDGDGFVVACLQVPLLVRNRIWLGGNVPDEVASDPEYLNATQVNALVASAVAEAVAEAIKDVSGEDGISPTISMGTVGNGDTAAASLVPGANNTYTLNLTLPRGLQGNPGAAGGAPTIAVGTVSNGDTAAATLVPGANNTYTLNLTLPHGRSIEYMGLWDAATAYPLNAIVRYNGRLWLGLLGGNLGHAPGGDIDYWAEAARDGIGMEARFGHGENGPWHEAPVAAGDTHYCISVDGGANWSRPLPLSQPGVRIAFAYNPDAESDWSEATAGQDYSTVTGRWMRLTSSLGVVTEAYDVTGSAGVIAMRLQFDDGSNDWHAVCLPTDTKVCCYTADSSLRKEIDFNLGDGDTPVKLEFSPYADPWHVVYAEGDRFYRTSSDGGDTWSDPIPLAMEDAPLDGKCYVRCNGEWVLYSAAAAAGGTGGDDATASAEDGDLPIHSERRIWRYLTFPRPDDTRELHICWQTMGESSIWGVERTSVANPDQAFMHRGDAVVSFEALNAGDACLKVEHIAPCDVHVRLCWAYIDTDGVWHKGEWIYRNTLGVVLSMEGVLDEVPDFGRPEYYLIPIPSDAEKCAIQLSAHGRNWRGEPYWFSDQHDNPDSDFSMRMWVFDGQDLLQVFSADQYDSYAVNPFGPANAGQWIVFYRRGIPKHHIRAVWTGNTPAIYTWSPEVL